MKNIAVILASGNGTRFGTKLPKQFIKLAGKPVISYTIDAFQSMPLIDEIIIVTGENYVSLVDEIVADNNFSKVSKVICGGKERYESSWYAIESIEYDECNILFHDAVRPFVSHKIIYDCLDGLEKFNAVDVVAPPTDTIVKIKDNCIMSIPDRRYLGRGQTPQGFKKSSIKSAYLEFMNEENKVASDDCGIYLRYNQKDKILVVEGDEANFKITHQQDIYLADNIIRDGNNNQIDVCNIESNFEDKVIVIFGGTSGIGLSISVLAKNLGANVYSFSRSTGHDISNSESIKEALESVNKIEGKIDYVINTAGVLIKKPIMFTSQNDILESCSINYIGAIQVAKESYPYLNQTNGMLVNFTSSSYTRGRSHYSLYSSSKAAVVNLTQALSEEWYNVGIKVNCINPERTDTPMRKLNFGNEPKDTLLSSEDVALRTLYLMSNDQTGQIITVKK